LNVGDLVCREVEPVSGAGGEIAIGLRHSVGLEDEVRKVGGCTRAVNRDRRRQVRVRFQIYRRPERLHHLRKRLVDEEREVYAQLTIGRLLRGGAHHLATADARGGVRGEIDVRRHLFEGGGHRQLPP
jgi:hypothetical protein